MSPRALIIIENVPYALDSRVRHEVQALRRGGWSVRVICPRETSEDGGWIPEDHAGIISYPTPPAIGGVLGYVIEYAWSLAWILVLVARTGRPGIDVVQVCNPPDVLFVAGLLSRAMHGSALIFDHHDLAPELYSAKFGSTLLMTGALRLLERMSFGFADVVISVNASHRRVAVSRGHKDSRRVHVVRNGPDHDAGPIASGTRDSSGDSQRHHVVGYLGMMGDQDGIDVLVRAAHHIVVERCRDDVRFQLIGDGPALPRAQELALELGVADRIAFLGLLRGEAMYQALQQSDVCVAPDPRTDYSDKSTMIKVMDYMSLGLPVVQFDLLEGRCSAGEAALYARPSEPRDSG